MFGQHGGIKCEDCDTEIPGDTQIEKEYKRKCRDLFLFQQLCRDCPDMRQYLVVTRDKSLKLDGKSALVLRGWKSQSTATNEAVIDLIMSSLAGDRDLPKSWSSWKDQRSNAGAICHRCWNNFLPSQ